LLFDIKGTSTDRWRLSSATQDSPVLDFFAVMQSTGK